MKTWMVILGVALAVGAVLLFLPDDGERSSTSTSATTSDPTPAELPPTLNLPRAGSGSPVDGVIADGEYAHELQQAGMTLYWRNDGERLHVGLASPGVGYVSIGFDPERGMRGANYILGAVVVGWVAARDDVGTGQVAHEADVDRGGTDDIVEWGGAETEDGTVFEFVIPLDSGDSEDKPLTAGGSYTVLLAYHESSDDFFARHTARGEAQITLDPAP